MFIPGLIIVVGVVWLLKSLGILNSDIWSLIWPVALIILGISMLFRKGRRFAGQPRRDQRRDERN